jgi:NADPH:quinone reductase-like Zn-dependent oxidoreductase/ubiquinone/menaquinone biosynthesis C-methylase UbiE
MVEGPPGMLTAGAAYFCQLTIPKLLPNPVLPASGYVCLAIEAASQFINTRKESSDDFCFRIRNLSIKAAMILADDDFGLETMVNLEASSHSSNWLEFEISSVSTTTDTWTEHASGLISRVPQPSQPLEPLDKSFDARIINVKDWYEKFTDIGLGYGKSFQGLTDLSSDPERCISKAKVMLNTTKGMFKGQESSYIIHPASLDLCHQLALIACHGGQAGRVKNAFIPVFIDDMTIWPQRYCEEWGGGTAVGHLKGLRGAHASVQLLDQSGAPRLAINQLRCVAHFGGSAQDPDNLDPPSPYTRLTWKPDISTLTSSQAKELFPPPISLGAVQNIFDAMDKVSVFMVIELATKYRNFVCKDSYLQRFLLWLQNSAVKLQQQHEEVFQMSSENRLKTIENVCSTMEDVVDIKHTKRVFDNIFAILTGTTTGVEVSLQDGNLAELYASGVGIAAAYPQLERILDLASHRDPSMKILEIGAGTGSATHRAMRSLGADMGSGTCKRYSGYAFTDTSSAFLETAKVKFRNCKQVTYATLDINRCPFEQGFEQSYDLIIASQCLHATEDIHRTLENVHKLLKPGGRVVLLETTRPLLGHGLAYGTFPDYWKSDENPDSPFLDVGQWENELKKAGFSGIDIELQDYDPSVAIVSVIVATSLPKQSAVVLPVTEDDVYIIYNQQLTTFHEVLASELRGRGITPLLISFDSFSLPSKSRVIFAVDLDLHVLIDGEEKDFERVKDIVRTASSLLWLTNGGLLAGDDPSAALGTGLIRMLNTENPLSNFGIFHLQGNDCFGSPVAGQIAERELRLHTGDSDTEFALHKGVVHVSRLELDVDLNARYLIQNRSQLLTEKTSFPINAPMVADFETPGILSSLYFKKDSTLLAPLGDDFIEVKTSAIGLNWKDIAVSAGRIDMNFFSSEVSGVVTRCGSKVSKLSPGDRVYCLGWGKFGTRIQLHASFAQLMSQTESFTDMVSVPMAFCTAVYALNHLARLQKGEKILIQSATGGVGLAAIQIALSKGAEIFTTVGSEDKIRYLVGTCHIPRERIFSSRDLNDIPRLKAAVSGRGFDVILSSSNRDMLHETCRLIAPRGRFVDVGRVDVQNHSTMAMEIFSQNATFSSFDLSVMAVQDPQFCSE